MGGDVEGVVAGVVERVVAGGVDEEVLEGMPSAFAVADTNGLATPAGQVSDALPVMATGIP